MEEEVKTLFFIMVFCLIGAGVGKLLLTIGTHVPRTQQAGGANSPPPLGVQETKPVIRQAAPQAQSGNVVTPHEQWWPIVTQQALHLRLIGPTGSGKSVLAQAAASEFDGKLVILDPVWKRGNWGGLAAITVDDDGDYNPIDAAIKSILLEMKQRGAVLKQVDNPTFDRLTILFDEVPDTVTELPESAGLLIRRLGQRGRHGNMHLIGMGQSERVKAWGLEGYGDMAQNFATVYLGDKAIEKLAWVGDVSKYPAVLEWRGKLHAIDTGSVLKLSQRTIANDRLFALGKAKSVVTSGSYLTDDARELQTFLEERGSDDVPSHRAMEKHVCKYTGGAAIERVDRALLLLRKNDVLSVK